MIVSIILENKATNLIPVMVLKVAFDFCFRRVTKEGYSELQSNVLQIKVLKPMLGFVLEFIFVVGLIKNSCKKNFPSLSVFSAPLRLVKKIEFHKELSLNPSVLDYNSKLLSGFRQVYLRLQTAY